MAVPSHHRSQTLSTWRPPGSEASIVAVNLIKHLVDIVPRVNPGQIAPLFQDWMPATKTDHNHPKPIPKQPRRHTAIIMQILRRLRCLAFTIFVKFAPNHHRQNHAFDRVHMVRRKLVWQQRKRPHLLPTLKPRYRNLSLVVWKQIYYPAGIRTDLPPTSNPPAQRTHLRSYRPPVDFFLIKRFFVLPNRAEAVIVYKLDPC